MLMRLLVRMNETNQSDDPERKILIFNRDLALRFCIKIKKFPQ